ncbi:MAG: cellulase family glycosylhydrolase [Verrucomicrobiota bacterium]
MSESRFLYWGKEQTDYALRHMRRQGINITRLHGLNSLGNDARSFERLDYLLSKLGENGIYIILDLHYPLRHRFKATEAIPGLPQGGTAPYTQFFNDRVAEVMHQRMTNIFTHLNPYTRRPTAMSCASTRCPPRRTSWRFVMNWA